jgi:hypothetical protein
MEDRRVQTIKADPPAVLGGKIRSGLELVVEPCSEGCRAKPAGGVTKLATLYYHFSSSHRNSFRFYLSKNV